MITLHTCVNGDVLTTILLVKGGRHSGLHIVRQGDPVCHVGAQECDGGSGHAVDAMSIGRYLTYTIGRRAGPGMGGMGQLQTTNGTTSDGGLGATAAGASAYFWSVFAAGGTRLVVVAVKLLEGNIDGPAWMGGCGSGGTLVFCFQPHRGDRRRVVEIAFGKRPHRRRPTLLAFW